MGMNPKTVLMSIFLCLFGGQLTFCQEENEGKPIREYVNVINVEMVLRVMKDGHARGGFKKEDFRLFENGKECEINGFFETRSKMTPLSQPLRGEKADRQPGRLFLLFFWSNRSHADIQEKLDHFFNTLYQPEDRVFFGSSSQVFEIRSPVDRDIVIQAFLTHWQEFLTEQKNESRHLVQGLGGIMSDIKNNMESLIPANEDQKQAFEQMAHSTLKGFFRSYRQAITDWQLRNNRIDPGSLRKMAGDISNIRVNKWALVFYERDNLPLLEPDKVKEILLRASAGLYSSFIEECINDIRIFNLETKMSSGSSSSIQSLRDAFIQAGAVFHLLQMSPQVPKELENDITGTNVAAINMEPVFSNWDAVFQTISKASGGQIVDLDKGIGELDKLAHREDISYTLTYVPREKKAKERKIELRIVNPELKHWQKNLLYGHRLEMEAVPQLKVAGIGSSEEQMKITLESFYPVNTSTGPVGHFAVSLAAEKAGSPAKVLYQEDVESSGEIEIPLQIKDPGDWILWIRIVDLMSGQSLLEKRKLSVLEEKPPIAALIPRTKDNLDELKTVLQKSAAYSELLKKTALRFTCIEEIDERSFNRKSTPQIPKYDKITWTYDYQIVLDQGTLTENRLLMKKNRYQYSPPKPAQLETFFESQYSFFMPSTFLASDNQPDYEYMITGRDKIKKRDMLKIRAIPKDNTKKLPGGEIWVAVEDGSIWKIVLDTKTVPAFHKRYQTAATRGIKMIMSDVHEYFERYDGIQFPSKTLITENHTYTKIIEEKTVVRDVAEIISIPRLGQPVQLEVLRVNYSYEKYRFFEVNSKAIIKDP